MSETISFPPVSESAASAKRTPTVYFIDDSATMREVIKIAFRRENITVITCGDAASAVAQFDQSPPDAVITDVIMPDQDGYSVCSQIKQHERFGATPVILMSGVVNKNVADKAVSVGADELIRKPFQPQELIARVKSFLGSKIVEPAPPAPAVPHAPSPLSSLFAPALPTPHAVHSSEQRRESPRPAPSNAFPSPPAPGGSPAFPSSPNFAPQAPVRPHASAGDIQKLKTEISRLELLIKKLQAELQIERQYNQALELHVKSLTSVE
jgi:CheY-like chemotaxis protein